MLVFPFGNNQKLEPSIAMKSIEPPHPKSQAGIMAEKFISDHVLIYLAAGTLHCFNATQHYTFRQGDYFMARKNRLARYKIEKSQEGFDPIAFCFDEPFLNEYQKKHQPPSKKSISKDTFIAIRQTEVLASFIHSLTPYYTGPYQLDKDFEAVKQEELLLILLKQQPELANFLFDFGAPEKIDLEEFMQKNFMFNVSLKRFAFLTGRSISAFKRDFFTIFNDTPSHWLVQRRLQEAYFLIGEKFRKPSDIYLDLGFEALSHFSAAFKKQFGFTPTELTERTKPISHSLPH